MPAGKGRARARAGKLMLEVLGDAVAASRQLERALMALPGTPTLIDLLEWKEPRDSSPPYPHLYHLGLARIALTTTDLDADMAELEREGVEFLSPPASLAGPAGAATRFVCFKDPDGTVLELVELPAS